MAPLLPGSGVALDYQRWRRIIIDGALEFDLHTTDQQIEQLFRYMEALLQWSPLVNLTAIQDPYEIAVKHFVDSLAPMAYFMPSINVLDMGSGAGFPGLPLKIWRPSIELTLVDAVRKKVSFLQHVTRQLNLNKVKTIHARVEHLSGTPGKPVFDTIVCRAFSDLQSIVNLALPLLAKTGQLVIWKGRYPESEIAAARPLLESASYPLTMRIETYRLPFIDAQRTLLIISAHA